MSYTTHTLKCGISIRDARELGCGILVDNGNFKYLRIGHQKDDGKYAFYVSIVGGWVSKTEIDDFCAEAVLMKEAIAEADELINGKAES